MRVLCLSSLLLACGHHGGGSLGGGDAGGDAGVTDASDGGTTGSDGGTTGSDGGSGTCGSCGAPPADVCEDGSHLRRYDDAPGCAGSACVFPSHVVDCPYGCAAGACEADACSGVACTAPAASCSGSTLRTYTATCTNGTCAIGESDEACANGCAAGACLGPTCGVATCDAPPAATCLDAKVLSGSAELGTCSGSCVYAPLQTLCSTGCFAGACETGSTESIFMPPVPGPSGSTWQSNLAFAVDAAGRPHLAGQDGNRNLTYRHLDETGWHDLTVDTNLGSGVQVALALDPAGSPVIAYLEPTNQRLRYAELRAGSFHIEEVSMTSPAGLNPSIAVDASGVVWIASNDGSQLRVAHGHAGSWTFETLGSYSGATQLAFDPAGVLHLVWGAAQSYANPSGSYSQPPAYHAARVGGVWHIDQVSPHGLVFARGLTFANNGDALVAYGVVGLVGQNDELRLRRYGAIESDVLVESLGNWLYASPIGLYDGRADLKFIERDASTLARGAGDLWTTTTHDFPPYPSVLDAVDGPDGRPRFLANLSSNSPANVSGTAFVIPPACVASCTGATCGSDGCGGTCGTCGAGEACGPDRQCSPWLEETVNLPALVTYPSTDLGIAMSPAGAHHLLVHYDFPEHYYTAGSTQDELFYTTDASGPWELPQPQTVVGIPAGNYAQVAIVPASLQVGPGGEPEAIFAYGLAGYTWSVEHAIPGMQPWMVDWSNSAGQAHPRLLDVARNAAGVTYVITECGYYGDVACVDRRDANGHTTETLTGDYAVAARAAVDSAGHVHILWTHWTTGSTDKVTLEYATDESGTLVSTPIAGEQASGSTDVFHPLIALGPADEIHVAFVHGGSEVHHGAWTGASFAIDVVPAAGALALAVDHAGVPAILAVQGTARLWRPAGATWASEPIPTAGNASAPWLAFDAANRAHVMFEDASSVSRQLRLAWRP
ncbi:MAG: hypothetical protein ACM31C_10735 [Acidobacteriota bacterium]